MNKTELTKQVAQQANLSQKDAAAAVNAVFDVIMRNIDEGVTIPGFGSFGSKTRSARQGVNLVTKEKIEIPAAVVPYFKTGKALKDACKAAE